VKAVPAIGRARLTIVADTPQRYEVERGRQLCGGPMFARGLQSIGLDVDDCAWLHAVPCAVEPGDLPKARKACAPALTAQLDAFGSDITIVPLGAYALQSVCRLERKPRILNWRGTVAQRGEAGARVMAMVHPEFVRRAQAWAPILERDVAHLGDVLRRGWVAPELQPGRQIVIADSVTELSDRLSALAEVVGVDIETVGLGPTHTRLVCLALSDAHTSVVLPWSTASNGHECWWADPKAIKRLITKALRDRVAVTHNGPAFDHIVLRRYGMHVRRWEDTLLAAHAIAGHMPKRLGHVASYYVSVPPWKEFEHSKAIEDLHVYNGRDTLYTRLAWSAMQRDLDPVRNVYEVDKRAAILCRDAQVNGFAFDRDRARAFGDALAARQVELIEKACELAGERINLLSPTDLRRVIFGRMGAPVFFRSKTTKQPSLGVDAMRAYAVCADEQLRDLALTVLDYRRVTKVRSTNVIKVPVSSKGRIHPTWMNYGAVSGRWSCQGPNLMNLPRKENDPTADLGGIRSLYVARPGTRLLAFDAKQLEMRVAAYASGDAAMIAACESSDLHAANAAVIFGAPFSAATGDRRKALRSLAKSAGFAVAYMAQAQTVYARIVASGTPITLSQVEGMLRRMRRAFAAYYTWQEANLADTVRRGYVESPIIKRRRWLGHEPSPTECANFPIQAGAADLMNLRLPEIVDAVTPMRAKLVAQVHDSAVFEVPVGAVEEAKATCVRLFEAPIRVGAHDVIFPVDIGDGDCWSEV
jgi:DNA polymerase I-like protein with 3'-5' exonuclease and polymerase domains/uracil-DNA glycosylase